MLRSLLARSLTRLAGWLAPQPSSPLAGFAMPPSRSRPVGSGDLLSELRNTAWTCASLNAAVCASFAPRLYVRTAHGQPPPRCATRALDAGQLQRLRHSATASIRLRGSFHVEEVCEHPLLDLLAQVNPVHNGFDLWELTTLSQEVHGCAYWLLEFGPLGTPIAIWPLPAHCVTPVRASSSDRLVDSYLYRDGATSTYLSPEQVLAFRYPDLRDPYTAGVSPLRACFEQVRLMAELAAFKQSKFTHHALPDAIISPDEVISEDERTRLEMQWNDRLRRSAGRVIVAESALRVQLLEHSLGDLAALADLRATKEDVCNAFGVPLAFLTSQTNLANLQAAEQQHLSQTIRPRLRRRDEKLNEQLVPLFDPTGRLFLASDDPVPADRAFLLRRTETYLRLGVLTVNEVRSQEGLPPLPE